MARRVAGRAELYVLVVLAALTEAAPCTCTVTVWRCQSDARYKDSDSSVLGAIMAGLWWFSELTRGAEVPE